ncbi:MAG: FumA C-terminus/TtdB family hydratase beta subunit [Spirochaetaceae bacterium]|nr:FumA C-terminus/TtdB family hydratase beta subunit [Spirochaetaceae bacterium]
MGQGKTASLRTPLSGEALTLLRAGDVVELSGEIITARDAAHKRIVDALAGNKALPVDLQGKILFYAGPCPAKPSQIIGSIAPTTSFRMDAFLEEVYKQGVSATIGKGPRTAAAAALCAQYKRVYFLSYGGAAALISKQVKRCAVLAYEDLGAESMKALEMENMRLVVGIDAQGRVFETEQTAKYRRGG